VSLFLSKLTWAQYKARTAIEIEEDQKVFASIDKATCPKGCAYISFERDPGTARKERKK